jgi:hypothetical protein
MSLVHELLGGVQAATQYAGECLRVIAWTYLEMEMLREELHAAVAGSTSSEVASAFEVSGHALAELERVRQMVGEAVEQAEQYAARL